MVKRVNADGLVSLFDVHQCWRELDSARSAFEIDARSASLPFIFDHSWHTCSLAIALGIPGEQVKWDALVKPQEFFKVCDCDRRTYPPFNSNYFVAVSSSANCESASVSTCSNRTRAPSLQEL